MEDEIKYLYRARRYWYEGWKTWYEQCPIVKRTDRFFTVTSETFEGSPLYKGGNFRLSREIERSGKIYHSRHGEEFFLEPQADAFLFPSSDVLDSKDFVTREAHQKGWTGKVTEWEEWQRDCWVLAKLLKRPLQSIVDEWTHGGASALEKLWEETRSGCLSKDN
jgi:hypothetical protein